MSIINQDVIRYIQDTQPLFDGVLGEIQREGIKEEMPIVQPEVARFLAVVLSVIRPKAVLEIGCAIGFSAGIISRYLKPGGHITTMDRYDVMIQEAKKNFKRLGIEDRVTLLEGDALTLLSGLSGSFDFIFLDAAKGQYIHMLPYCKKLLRTGGVMIADDCFQGGNIMKERLAIPRRQRTIHTRMRAFLEEICHDEGLVTSLVPIGDGLALIHKTEVV